MENLPKSPKSYTILELKDELKSIGAKTSGSKSDLIKRLNIWKSKNLNRSLCITDKPNGTDEDLNNNNYTNEIVLSSDLKPLCDLDHKSFSFITISLITDWFISKYAKSSLDRGFRLAQHNFIVRILAKQSDLNASTKLIAATCYAEMTKHKVYTVKLVFANEAVSSATCECVAGSGTEAACKHVSAIMAGLQHYGSTGKSLERISPTSSLQTWHQPALKKHATKIKIYEHIKRKPIETKFLAQYAGQDQTSVFQNLLINKKELSHVNIKRNVNPVAYFEDHCYLVNLHRTILDAINRVTDEERESIKKTTVKQRSCKFWIGLRKSRITASNAYDVITTVRSNRFNESVAKRIVSGTIINTSAMRWGIKNEAKALLAYENKMGLKINKIGLCIDDMYNFLAASPDGITQDETKIIEIKCPYSIRKDSNLDNLKYVRNGTLIKNHKYYLQCQLQMRVTNTKMCDFVVWLPQDIFVMILKYDESYVKDCIADIEKYYDKVFCKKYLNHLWS